LRKKFVPHHGCPGGGTVALERGEGVGKVVGKPLIVAVEERHDLPARLRDPAISCRSGPAIRRGDYPNPLILHPLGELHTSIGRSIIDDDHLEVVVALRHD
jgi:hypothetical protein